MNCKAHSGGCGFVSTMAAAALDAIVWAHISHVLSNPEVIGRELAQREREGDQAVDIMSVNRAITEIERQQGNITRRIPLIDDDGVMALLMAQLKSLNSQKHSLQGERAALMAAREQRGATLERLRDVESWCRNAAAKAADFTFEQRRIVILALGVRVKLYGADHSPRFEITANIPLGEGNLPELNLTGDQPALNYSRRALVQCKLVQLRWTSDD